MYTKTLFVFVLSSIIFTQAHPQLQPSIIGQHAYASSDYSFFKTMKLTRDAGFILGGISYGTGINKTEPSRGSSDYWVIKTDSAGKEIWDKTLGTASGETFADVISTRDHGFLVGGNTNAGISGDKTEMCRGNDDFWIVKLDSNGHVQWDKTIGGSGTEELKVMDATADGGFILGGNSDSPVSGDKTSENLGGTDYWIVKIDAAGNIKWDKTYGTSDYEYLTDIKQTKDKGYIVGGGLGLLKLDAKGNKQWMKAVSAESQVYKILQLPNEQYIAGGVSTKEIGINRAGPNYWFLHTDRKGRSLFEKILGGNGNDVFESMCITSDQGLLIAGSSDSYVSGDKGEDSKGESDYWVLRLNLNGDVVWQKTIGGSDKDNCYAVCEYQKDYFVLGGSSVSSVSGNKTVRLKGLTDYWTIKLKYPDLQTNILSAQTALKANNDAAFTVFPNPATTVLHIQTKGNATLVLYNSEGKAALRKTISGSGDMYLPHLPAGIYYLQNTATGDMKKVAIE